MKNSSHDLKPLVNLALAAVLLGWLAVAGNLNYPNPRPRPAVRAQHAASRAPLSGDRRNEGDPEGRDDWFYAQRAYPLRTIPHAARLRAIEQVAQEEERRRQLSAASPGEPSVLNAPPSWTPLGPEPIADGQTFGNSSGPVPVAGRVAAIALDPGYNNTTNKTLYLGAAQGGVWRSRDNGQDWTPLTDDQPSLAVGAIAIDPTNPNVIYAGTGEGNATSGDSYFGAGLLKSTNGGASWTRIAGPVSTRTPRIPAFLNAGFTRITIDPVAPSTVYVCTTTGFASSASAAVPLGQRGVWKSTDGGQTWRNLDPTNENGARAASDLMIDPLNHNQVFAAMYGKGIYHSKAGGEPGSWEELANGLPTSGLARITLAVGPKLPPSTTATLYAAFATAGDKLLGIFKSVDDGTNWSQLTRPQRAGQSNYCLALAVDPVDANLIYYGTSANDNNNGGSVFRSTNGGQNWQDISLGNGAGGVHADQHALVVSPADRNTLFSGNDGGIFRSANATAATVGWASLNQTLSITQFESIALHPTNANFLLGGTQDNGTDIYNGQAAWTQTEDGDGGFALIDQSNPRVMYHTFFNQSDTGKGDAQIGPSVSTNGGGSWAPVGCEGCTAQLGGFNPTDRVGFYPPMALHTGFTNTASGNIIYFGTHRLYRSADRGQTWIGIGPSADGFGTDLTTAADSFSVVSAIAAHPRLNGGNPQGEAVWVGTSDGLVQLTANAGALDAAKWTDLTKAPLPDRFVTEIALDPLNQRRAFVTYSGFNANTPASPGHVFMTSDAGASWTDISGNLPDIPVNTIALDPTRTATLYVGTDIGVFQTTDGGATWALLSNGLPRVAVFMLRYQASTGSLIAATHGRGVYRLALNNALANASSASFLGVNLASESIAVAGGSNLATSVQSATAIPLPTSLAGTSVRVRDSTGVERLAPLFFVSPGQVNYQIPPGTLTGAATVTIIAGDGTTSIGAAQITAVTPGLYAANSDGQGVAAALALRAKADGSQSFENAFQLNAQNRFISRPIDLGPASDQVFLILFGTGLRFRSSLTAVTAKIGGVDAQVLYAGAQGSFVGLDQVNLSLPRSLIGRGEVDLALTVDGRTANTVRVNIK